LHRDSQRDPEPSRGGGYATHLTGGPTYFLRITALDPLR
jgi:hypothetical protein